MNIALIIAIGSLFITIIEDRGLYRMQIDKEPLLLKAALQMAISHAHSMEFNMILVENAFMFHRRASLLSRIFQGSILKHIPQEKLAV